MNKHTGDTLRSIITSELTKKKKTVLPHISHFLKKKRQKQRDTDATRNSRERGGCDKVMKTRGESANSRRSEVWSYRNANRSRRRGGGGGPGASAVRARRQNVLNYGRADNGS